MLWKFEVCVSADWRLHRIRPKERIEVDPPWWSRLGFCRSFGEVEFLGLLASANIADVIDEDVEQLVTVLAPLGRSGDEPTTDLTLVVREQKLLLTALAARDGSSC